MDVNLLSVFEIIPFQNHQGTKGKAILVMHPDDYNFIVKSLFHKEKKENESNDVQDMGLILG